MLLRVNLFQLLLRKDLLLLRELDRFGTDEEVDGDELLGVMLQECARGLRRRLAAPHPLFGDAGLSDVDPEFEKFAVGAGCTSAWILPAIWRIKSRTSREMSGRPGWPRRTFQAQNRRKAARCQATTVSGLIMASVERQSRQSGTAARERKIEDRVERSVERRDDHRREL